MKETIQEHGSSAPFSNKPVGLAVSTKLPTKLFVYPSLPLVSYGNPWLGLISKISVTFKEVKFGLTVKYLTDILQEKLFT